MTLYYSNTKQIVLSKLAIKKEERFISINSDIFFVIFECQSLYRINRWIWTYLIVVIIPCSQMT